jgi:TRAP-type C4-dicarboxylate transport system permease small subunit
MHLPHATTTPSPLRRGLDALYLASGWLAGLFLVIILALMMALSVGRQVGINIASGDDFAAWSMAALAFLSLAYTFRSGEIIRIGFVLDRLDVRVRRAAELACLALGASLVGFFAWHAARMNYDSWRFDDMSHGVVAVPLWIPQLGYSIGLAILFVAFVDEFAHVLRGGDPRYEKPKPKTAAEVIERAIESGV